jgi:DNA-3-methyladenine glycosylase I
MQASSENRQRCGWAQTHPLHAAYHDAEWGVPLHDDRMLFEMLNLEGAQAGLSWLTVLKKRQSYRDAFDNFEAAKIVHYDDAKVAELLANEGIIRNRLKVNAVIANAKAYLEVVREFKTFDSYIWQFTSGKPLVNRRKTMAEVPAKSVESDAMSKALAKRGFKFVGSTICYAYMQAIGMVDDHTDDCWRRRKA